jgi:hypothetical protein
LILCLDAAFDAGARVLSSRFNLGNEQAARWRSPKFQAKLVAAESAFEPLLQRGGLIADATTVLGALRKTVHGVPLESMGLQSPLERDGTRMMVSPETLQEFEGVARDRGGLAGWGVEVLMPDMPHIDLYYFVEQLVPLVVEALNALIHAATGTTLDIEPNGAWGHTPETRRQLRLLAGVEHWQSGPPTGGPIGGELGS